MTQFCCKMFFSTVGRNESTNASAALYAWCKIKSTSFSLHFLSLRKLNIVWVRRKKKTKEGKLDYISCLNTVMRIPCYFASMVFKQWRGNLCIRFVSLSKLVIELLARRRSLISSLNTINCNLCITLLKLVNEEMNHDSVKYRL